MKVVIVDDEKSMLIIMKRMLSQLEDIELEIAGSFQKGAKALNFVRDTPVDLAFIDISLAGESGIQLARDMLSIRAEVEIVFVTSHREFALEAFDACAFDYIVKPIARERLKKTVERAARKAGRMEAIKIEESRNRLLVNAMNGLEIRGERTGTVKWISAKSAELFAYLLMHRGSSVSRERILEEVFFEMPLKNAEKYMNTAVYQVRKALALHGAKSCVILANEMYRLNLADMEVDFINFENRIAHLKHFDKSNDDLVYETLTLCSGVFLGDKSYIWSLPEKERLSDLYTGLAKGYGRWLLDNRHFTRAIEVVKELVRRNNLDEEANRLLLQIYAETKERQLFITHYEQFSQILLDELGVKPAHDTACLYARLSEELFGSKDTRNPD